MMLRNQKGITLVEVLAVFVISAIVTVLFISVHFFIQKEFQHQRIDQQELTDISIAMKSLTKDLRMKTINTTTQSSIIFTDSTGYRHKGETLYKNDEPYIYEVKDFQIDFNQDRQEIAIVLESTHGKRLETNLTVR